MHARFHATAGAGLGKPAKAQTIARSGAGCATEILFKPLVRCAELPVRAKVTIPLETHGK